MNLFAAKRKKKAAPPSKVAGGNARRRVDRKASGGPIAAPKAPLRSEFTEAEKARRTLRRTPPVTIMEDMVGRFNEAKGQSNALRDAVRQKAADDVKASGYEIHNQGFEKGYDFDPLMKDEGMKNGGKLSASQRQSLPSSDFALPGAGKGPKGAGAGSYPIPDEGHARSALQRGVQHASPGQLATIKRKVKAKFPGMNVS